MFIRFVHWETVLTGLAIAVAFTAGPIHASAWDDQGTVISNNQDLTADGVNDAVIAKPSENDPSMPGSVDVRSGTTGDVTVQFRGVRNGDKFGHSVAIYADFGVGSRDLLVGAPQDEAGKVFGFFGPFTGGGGTMVLSANEANFTLTCPETATKFGQRVSMFPDMDRDLVSEIIVSARVNNQGTESSRTYVFSGATRTLLFAVDGDNLFTTALSSGGPSTSCLGDITGIGGLPDGIVDIDDLFAVINGWGPCPATPAICPGDIMPRNGGDGVVDIDDLFAVINGWGPCPPIDGVQIFRTNGTGGGDWFDPNTWVPNGVPASVNDYDAVRILPGDTVTQSAPTPMTLGYYLLDPGGAHTFSGTATLKALEVEGRGQWNNPAGQYGSVTVINAVKLSRPRYVHVDRVYDCETLCPLLENAPLIFADLGPCTAAQCDPPEPPSSFDNTTTHRALTDVAADNQQSKLHDFVRQDLMDAAGVDTVATNQSGVSMTYKDWMVQGADHEDVPDCRVLNHFLNPLTNGGLSGWSFGEAADVWARKGVNGQCWLLPGGAQYYQPNDYSFDDAREAYFNMLTAPTTASRMNAASLMFYDLGHTCHLLQDMAQPAHVRNDPHPFDRPLEDFAATTYGTVLTLNGLNAVDTFVDTQHPKHRLYVSLPDHVLFRDEFDTDQWTGQPGFTAFATPPGIAEYSNINFFSEDTIFDPWFPRPAFSDTNFSPPAGANYHISMMDEPIPAPDMFIVKTSPSGLGIETGFNLCAGKNRGVSVKEHDLFETVTYRYEMSIENFFVLQAYCQRLLPQAIAYSTDMINFFFRGKLGVELLTENSPKIRVMNQSTDTIAGGQWWLYHVDSQTGQNTQVGSASFSQYSGSLGPGQSFDVTFTPPANGGVYTVVYKGTLGSESLTAVAGRKIDLCPCTGTWTTSGQVTVTETGVGHCDVEIHLGDDKLGSNPDSGQAQGTRGATATFHGASHYEVKIDYDISSWDAYNDDGSVGNGNQFWDVVFVNVNDEHATHTQVFGSPFETTDNLGAVNCSVAQSSSTFMPGATWWVGGYQPSQWCHKTGTSTLSFDVDDPDTDVFVSAGIKTGYTHPTWGTLKLKIRPSTPQP